MPTGRKRRRVCAKKKNEEQKAKELDTQATQPPTSELVVALNALPRAEEPPQTVNELMDHTLERLPGRMCRGRDVSIGSCHRSGGMGRTGPRPDGGELERPLVPSMPVSSPPIHPLSQPPDRIWQVKVQVPPRRVSSVFVRGHPRCDVANTQRRHPSPSASPIATKVAEVQMWVYPQDEIKSHHQELQQSVFELWELSPRQEPCGYFQWLHGPLLRPREPAQPSLRRWVKETLVPLLKRHCLDTGREQIDGPIPRPMLYGTRDNTGWTSMCKTPIMPDQQ